MSILNSKISIQKPQEYLADVYGGKKAFLRYVFFSAKAGLGGYSTYRHINCSIVSRLIFVCHGNICRSPYAEYKYRMLGECAISAGLEAKAGNHADSRAKKVANDRGVHLHSHRSNNINNVELYPGDLLVAFEPSHASILSNKVRHEKDIQVTLLGLWSPQPWSVYFHDPYGLPEKYFENCFHRIDLALAKMCVKLEAARQVG